MSIYLALRHTDWGHCKLKLLWFKSNLIKCRFFRSGENHSTQGKTSQSREEKQQTQTTYDAESGNRTWATLVGGECSHHDATTALTEPVSHLYCSRCMQIPCVYWSGNQRLKGWTPLRAHSIDIILESLSRSSWSL